MSANHVTHQRAQSRFRWRRIQFRAQGFRRRETTREQAYRSAFHIALDAGDLAGEPDPWVGLQAKPGIQQLGGLDEGVAVKPPQTGELGVLQSGDHAKDVGLRRVLQLGLKTDHIVERSQRVILAKLDDGIGLLRRVVRVGQTDRLHGAMTKGLPSALRHHLDRETTVEIGRGGFPLAEVGARAAEQGVDKRLVGLAIHRAVDVRRCVSAGPLLVIPRLPPGDGHVDGVDVKNGRNGVKEMQGVLARSRPDLCGEGVGGQRSGRDDRRAPVLSRPMPRLFPHDLDVRLPLQGGGHVLRERDTVHGQRSPGRNLMEIGCSHDQGA